MYHYIWRKSQELSDLGHGVPYEGRYECRRNKADSRRAKPLMCSSHVPLMFLLTRSSHLYRTLKAESSEFILQEETFWWDKCKLLACGGRAGGGVGVIDLPPQLTARPSSASPWQHIRVAQEAKCQITLHHQWSLMAGAWNSPFPASRTSCMFVSQSSFRP